MHLSRRNTRLIIGIRVSREIKVASCLLKIQSFGGKTGVNTPGHILRWWYMEAVRCQVHDPHLSAVPTMKYWALCGLAAAVAEKLTVLTANRYRGFTPDFLSRQRRFQIRIPFPLAFPDRQATSTRSSWLWRTSCSPSLRGRFYKHWEFIITSPLYMSTFWLYIMYVYKYYLHHVF